MIAAARAKAEPVPPASVAGLSRVRLFQGLAAEALEHIAASCRWRRYAQGQHIISRDARDTDVYFVVGGVVQVTAFAASGRQVTYGEMRAGEWFGDFSAIDGLARSADVIALDDTLVASMAPASFRQLLFDHPAVCDRMLRRLVACVRELTDRVFDFSTLGVQNRVHAELLRLAHHAGVKENSARIDPAPKHTDIAAQISTYREQVTRELSSMVKHGLLQRSGRALIIPDVAKLERLVEEVRRSA
jgi:CRP/FNR family cyclic AMP-dependent transcriptional regulator